MKVLFTSSSYPLHPDDWRGVFIARIVEALSSQSGIDLVTWCPPGAFPDGVSRATTPGDDAWLEWLSRQGGIAKALRSPFGALRAIELLSRLRAVYRRVQDAELIHANWLQLCLPLPRDRRPLLATVLGTDFKLLHIPGMVRALRRVFSSRETMICPNADWMVPHLQDRFSDVAHIRCIPFGIDSTYFELRRNLVHPNRWLCVTRITGDKIGDLFEWGSAAFRSGARELHLIGPMQDEVILPDWVIYHGPASQASLQKNWFPGASGLISLSRHAEGRPQVMLEAMAAGIPVVASDIPAHRDLLANTGAGVICAEAEDLLPALVSMEGDAGLAAGERARAFAKEAFGTWNDCAGRFVACYRELRDQ